MQSLSARYSAAALAVLLAALAGLAVYAILTAVDTTNDAVDDRLTAQARQLAGLAASALAANDAPALAALAGSLAQGDSAVTFIAPDGTVLGDSTAAAADNQAAQPEIAAAAANGIGRSSRRAAALGESATIVAAAVRDGEGTLLGFARVALPDSAREGTGALVGSIAIALAVAALVGALAILALNTALARPLRRLGRAALAAAPLPLGGPEETRAIARAINATHAKLQSERDSLAGERRRLDAALAASADIVIAVDPNGAVLYANPAARADRPPGTPPDEPPHTHVVGASLLDVLPDHQVYALIREAQRGTPSPPTLIRHHDRHFQVLAAPVAEGGDWSVVLVMHDVTALHAAEAARRDLVANISHELRTPLTAISAAIETLEQGLPPNQAPPFHRIIHAESDRMAQLVEEMLELARLESGLTQPQIRTVAVAQLIEEAAARIRPQAERAGLTLRTEPPTPPGLACAADPDLAQQALLNLLQNATKFTPPPGSITVSARLQDDAVWLSVRDTGIGIPRDEQGRVFQRFYQLDRSRAAVPGTDPGANPPANRGSGLGLALVRHIAQIHGGDVALESELGRGSTFSFSLPRAPAPAGDTNSPAATTGVPSS